MRGLKLQRHPDIQDIFTVFSPQMIWPVRLYGCFGGCPYFPAVLFSLVAAACGVCLRYFLGGRRHFGLLP